MGDPKAINETIKPNYSGFLYRLTGYSDELTKLSGWGGKSIENLFEAIEKSRGVRFDRFIYSLGIPQVGQQTAKLLAENYIDIEHLSLIHI